ncbi:MAG: hypothetical protein WAW37_04775 [Syntrophobacteraceae bacterium]
MTSLISQNWKIEHCCPQCGAPVVLEETDRIFQCSFCRVRLFIWSGDHFRYFIAPKAPVPGPLVFVPYWRLKGIIYSLDGAQISSGIIDSSLLAVGSVPLPPSLGVRPQVLKLRYATPEVCGVFLTPDLPFRALASGDLISPVPAAHPDPEGQIPLKYFIGEAVSLIFAPVFARGNTLFDAVLRKPLGAVPEAVRNRLPGAEARTVPPDAAPSGPALASPGRIGFLATQCPRCGWDLEGERDSLVLFCRNCSSSWRAEGGALRGVDFSFQEPGSESSVYLPFWRIRAGVSGLTLGSYGDLLRLANLPGTMPKGRENSELHFWIPAFKSQPNLFLRLARGLTILQKDADTGPEPSRSPLFPVTLPIGEALESIRILIASLAVPKRLIFPRIHEIDLSHEGHTLVYLPFVERGEELIQPQIRMSIQKNALKWGRLI